MKSSNKTKKGKSIFSSVKAKLFITLGLSVLIIILFLVSINDFALEKFYLFNKKNTLKEVYNKLNDYYDSDYYSKDIESELEEISVKNNFDILIRDNNGVNIYVTNNHFANFMVLPSDITDTFGEVLEENDNYTIKKQRDKKNGLSYIVLLGTLDNGYYLFIRLPINSIKDSVNISNNFLWLMASIIILISFVLVSIISKKFTEPILELNNITKKMAALDFSQKYQEKNTDDEINNLGKNINIMSDKLEGTIQQLRNSNSDLERDIEEKSKIDEMRKSFISDVSHELKTPIALIQGYSEGLIENVNDDDESRKFYAEVILDESNKMDKLVKKLLELMKLEYGEMKFKNTEFDITEVEKEMLRKSDVLIKEKNIELEEIKDSKIIVNADDFYIEQVITNYLTNAIKNVKEIDGIKLIRIQNKINKKSNKVRVSVFNTGDHIKEEDMDRIWNRFYKGDSSRNRSDGGTGIGLAFVKAIMNQYGNEYGVKNVENGVEFYFDLDLKLEKK